MVTITEAAQKKILELIGESEAQVQGLRLGAHAVSPLKVDFKMAFVGQDEDVTGDTAIDFEGFKLFINDESLPNAEEATVDYVDGLTGRGFKVESPHKTPPGVDGPMVERIQQVLDQRINPALASHGGNVSLIDVKDKAVYLQLGGGCQGCGMADVTLKQGIEVMLKEAVPEIEQIYDVTDHADGNNPYYQQSKCH